MTAIDPTKPILVTGGSGYVASWIIHDLLKDGKTVRISVRDKSNSSKIGHLQKIADDSEGTLEVFEADLLQAGASDEAVKGCELVMHTASPFIAGSVKNAQKTLVEPALEGTKNVLDSVSKSGSVKRVVLTSSIVAIFGDAIDIYKTENGIFSEQHWNTTSTVHHQPYPYSKTMAEHAAWDIANAQSDWELVVINPGFVLGPSLTKRRDSASINFMIEMGSGKYKMGMPDLYIGVVDVREIAQAHIKAGFNPKASGRHILSNQTMSFLEVAQILRKYYPNYPFPKSKLPKWLAQLFGPFMGVSRKFVKLNVGIPIEFDNSKSIKELGIAYRPVEETLKDHFEQLIRDGLVKKR